MARDEGDVFVDPDGSVVVGNTRAAGKLKSRAGAYAIMPSPPDLIVLRRTSGVPAGSRPLLSGEVLDRGTLLEILQLVTTAGWTGELLVIDGETRRSILFEANAVILATSNAPAERLGEVLYKHGALTREQFDDALRTVSPTRRLGDIVVQRGWIKPNDLYAMLQKQVEEIFYATIAMTGGTFTFTRGIDPAAIPVRVNLAAQGLLMEGVQRIDELAYFREKIPDRSVVPVLVPGKAAPDDAYAARVHAMIDGKRSLEDIARATALGEFTATKALYALLQHGVAKLGKPQAARGALAEPIEQFNDVLRAIHVAVDAGGVGAEARSTLAMFLQGGGAFDVLFANAGPLPDGAFATPVLLANVDHMRTEDPRGVVTQALHDYVAFALFAAGSVMRREDHQQLARRVQSRLNELRAAIR